MAELFGFSITRSKKTADPKQSFTQPQADDGTQTIAAGGYFGQYLDMEGQAKTEQDLIRRYREIALHPECDMAIEDIVNEAVVANELKDAIRLKLDQVPFGNEIKRKIEDEFQEVLRLMNFNTKGHDIFRRWYVDGRIYFHNVVNEANLKAGIQEVRPIDSAKIRKVKEVKRKKDPITGAMLIEKINEYYIYQEKPGSQTSGVKLSTDAITYNTSGVLSADRKKVVSYLHKALKPINQLRMMEDSLVIYRLARAPERRIFYIDVGNLPRGKSEQYMKDIMARYRNKLVYDAQTGELKDDRKHMSMLEDFWLPRREGGRGTEISTLPGGENLGQIDDIIYFQKRLYRSLNVPINRLEQEQQFSLGRSTEINRDELKFQKFIDRLRRKFSQTFLDILKKQLMLKGIITDEDWNQWKNDIVIDYVRDNHFTELKDAELLRERLQTMELVQPYVGEYYSKQWIMKHVLMLSDDDVKDMKKEISDEEASGEIEKDEPQNNQQNGDENGDN